MSTFFSNLSDIWFPHSPFFTTHTLIFFDMEHLIYLHGLITLYFFSNNFTVSPYQTMQLKINFEL